MKETYMNGYKGKAARRQQQDKEEQRMNKTGSIKVRCTLEEKPRLCRGAFMPVRRNDVC